MERRKTRQISVYADPQFLRKVEKEAQERHRKLGPTVMEILREYFHKKEARVVIDKSS